MDFFSDYIFLSGLLWLAGPAGADSGQPLPLYDGFRAAAREEG